MAVGEARDDGIVGNISKQVIKHRQNCLEKQMVLLIFLSIYKMIKISDIEIFYHRFIFGIKKYLKTCNEYL